MWGGGAVRGWTPSRYCHCVPVQPPSTPSRVVEGGHGRNCVATLCDAERCDVVLTSAPTLRQAAPLALAAPPGPGRTGRGASVRDIESSPSPQEAPRESAPPPSLARRDGGRVFVVVSRSGSPRWCRRPLSGGPGSRQGEAGRPPCGPASPGGAELFRPTVCRGLSRAFFSLAGGRSRSHRIAVPAVGRARGKIRARGVREAPYNNIITTPAPGQRQWHPSRPASAARRAPF